MLPNRAPPPFITRVRLRNYRSIAGCDVRLEPLTILVGPNGSGKSNFLDALRLTAESLRGSLDHALRERSGLAEVRRKSHSHPNHFGIRLDFQLDGRPGFFAFEVAARAAGAYEIRHEACEWAGERYEVSTGIVTRPPAPVSPPAAADRLYLVNAAGLPAFRPVFDALSTMGFYNISPAKIRELQTPDPGELLDREGTNLASVLDRLGRTSPVIKQRIEEYLARVVPGIVGMSPIHVGHMETIEFRQRVVGSKAPWSFGAINMSDGTLRALAVLTALFQFGERKTARLIGIEEPETALHPAAAGLLLDCLREGTRERQVVITTHSPDLLDSDTLSADQLLAVSASEGKTVIGPVDVASRQALRDSLYRAGELLRLGQLEPDESAPSEAEQLELFGPCA
ncbi:MAG TPA: AAA family ATPase [Kofleriaceae bacterium]